jgi:hypothetical protein
MLSADEAARAQLPPWVTGKDWRTFDLGRIALLVAALSSLPTREHIREVSRLVQHGEIGEQESLLRGLGLLPEAKRFVDVAVEACRTNANSVLEAIAADNPYPALHFPDLAFNQMVLKGVFMGMPAGRISGLADRASQELSRMALGYASERSAAGRSVPDDVEFIVGLSPLPPGKDTAS